MDIFEFAKENNINIPTKPDYENEEELNSQNSVLDTKGIAHKLIEYRGIFLTKEEFGKCCRISKILENNKKQSYNETLKLWVNLLQSQFGFEIKVEKLLIKDQINPDFLPFKEAYCCRFQKDRPLLFLIFVDNGDVLFVDEKQFDAFEKGPYQECNI